MSTTDATITSPSAKKPLVVDEFKVIRGELKINRDFAATIQSYQNFVLEKEIKKKLFTTHIGTPSPSQAVPSTEVSSSSSEGSADTAVATIIDNDEEEEEENNKINALYEALPLDAQYSSNDLSVEIKATPINMTAEVGVELTRSILSPNQFAILSSTVVVAAGCVTVDLFENTTDKKLKEVILNEGDLFYMTHPKSTVGFAVRQNKPHSILVGFFARRSPTSMTKICDAIALKVANVVEKEGESQ